MFRMFWISKADFCFPLRFPLSADGLDKSLHSVCTVFLHLFGHMTVHSQGKSGSCVTQIFLNRLHIITGFEGNHCVRVAKIMEADFGHVQFCHHQFECSVSCLGRDPASGLICEYQIKDFEKIVSPQSERLRYPAHFMFAGVWGGSLNKHETTHFQPSGNEWFSHFVYTNALLAPLQKHYSVFSIR